jgi:hypothetical protein
MTITQIDPFELAAVHGGQNRPPAQPLPPRTPDDLAHQAGLDDITKNIRLPKKPR